MRFMILDTNDKPPTEYFVGGAAEAKAKVDELFRKRAGRTKEAFLAEAGEELGCDPKDLEPLFYQLTFRHGLLVGVRNPDGVYDVRETALLED